MKSSSLNLIELNLGENGVSFTLRCYREPMWSFRKLGSWRYSLDLWRVSFILELWFIRA